MSKNNDNGYDSNFSISFDHYHARNMLKRKNSNNRDKKHQKEVSAMGFH